MSPLPTTDPDGNPYPAAGHAVIDAVIRAAAIESVVVEENGTITVWNGTIIVWAANAAEQIEAALAEAGWILQQTANVDAPAP